MVQVQNEKHRSKLMGNAQLRERVDCPSGLRACLNSGSRRRGEADFLRNFILVRLLTSAATSTSLKHLHVFRRQHFPAKAVSHALPALLCYLWIGGVLKLSGYECCKPARLAQVAQDALPPEDKIHNGVSMGDHGEPGHHCL